MNRIHRLIATGVLGGGAAPTYSISGTVYDADGTTAVASATVALGALTATSAANGTYTISNVPAGTSGSMTCTKTGYSWTAKTISAMAANLTSQNYTNAWWAALGIAASAQAAYKAIGAASLAASYSNLVSPGTNDAAPGTAPTFNAATGWSFTPASSQYLLSGVAANLKPATYIVRLTTSSTTGYRTAIGGSVELGPLSLDLTATTNVPRGLKQNVAVIGAADAGFSNSADVVIAFTYAANGAYVHYLNGATNGSGTGDQTLVSATLSIGAQRASGATYTAYFAGVMAALAVYNAVLTPTQVAALSAAMAALSP